MSFIPLFYSFLIPNQLFSRFLYIWNVVGLLQFWGSGFRCEDIILLYFYFPMLNDKILKLNSEMFLKREYPPKTKAISTEKDVAIDKKCLHWKNDLNITLDEWFICKVNNRVNFCRWMPLVRICYISDIFFSFLLKSRNLFYLRSLTK